MRSPFAATLLQRLDADDAALTVPLHADSTIAPEWSQPDQPGREAVAALMRHGAASDPGDGLHLLGTLGEGGMGIVHVAQQVRLGREVAVKTLRDGAGDELSRLTLLREAWVTGMLEHPNVVPVHDLAVDAAGRPRIVLKRIDGAPWSDLIGDEDEVRRRSGTSDPLEWHLRVLLQVANAVQFAHSRGVIHRDIKPDNVMIGAFGEVYLLDWGIAVSLVDDGTGRLPLARDATDLAGTPVYMAPEMVGGLPDRLSVRTDVYLLGAVLFEIVTGQPPHVGANLREVIARIVSSPPALPPSCPAELARIVQTAMALEPDARFADVAAFRAALTAFLDHRGSLSLSDDAALRAADLVAMIASRGDRAGEDLRVALYRTFAEARLGFREALRAWPDNEAAQRGLRAAVEAMVGFELESGDARAAWVLLSELTEPDPDLRARVQAARDEQALVERRRANLEADLDPRTGRRTRFLLGCVLGVVWTSGPLAAWVLEHQQIHARTLGDAVKSASLMIALASALCWWARDTLGKTAVNRRMRDALLIAVFAQLALYSGAWKLGVGMHGAEAIKVLVYAIVTAQVVLTVHRGFAAAVAGYLAAFALSTAWPPHVHLFEAIGNLVLTITMLGVWRATPARAR
jgi:serine/threonine-protein kinase